MERITHKFEKDMEGPKAYRWEKGYEKTWEEIKEDDDGNLDSAIVEIIQKAKRKRQLNKTKQNRLGMMRHLFVILDCSEAMNVADLKPTRLLCTIKLLEMFIKEYFDHNPISQLGLVALKSKRAEKLTDLTGTPNVHLNALKGVSKYTCSGEPSLQNGLDLTLKSLKCIPNHASREVLVIMGSLTTCDPVDINTTIEELKKEKIRCSVISLAAEIHVFRQLTQQTQGICGAVLDDSHFRDQLLDHVDPPPAAQTQDNSLIKMGFPHSQTDDGKDPPLSMCMCHIENCDEPSKLSSGGYHCPQCFSKYCELPVECQTCSLMLVSAPHLTRSYHHLFPVNSFTELEFNGQSSICYACQRQLVHSEQKYVYRCESCLQIFCNDCHEFILETLHACVGCNTIQGVATKVPARKAQNPM